MRSRPGAERHLERARRLMPGGVSSPVRAFDAVGGTPPLLVSGRGAYVVDVDGNRYCDYVMGYGPHILGHGPDSVRRAISDQLERGIGFGAPHPLELQLAERIAAAVPSIEMVRFVTSGTEATMSAIRLARAATGRRRVLVAAGAYHGHSDTLLASAGSGMATLGMAASAGIASTAAEAPLMVAYNDAAALQELLASQGEEVAAVLLEPVAGNMGCVPPRPGYLQAVRDAASRAGALLIFDEVITGFRVAYGGAQSLYGVTPDLTCLGKVIGGGLPIGAYGGRRGLMSLVAPLGPVYQAGTLSGNPLTMAAGCAVLEELERSDVYARLERLGALLAGGLVQSAAAAEVPCAVNRVGSMVSAFLGTPEVVDVESARRSSAELFARVHSAWLDGGTYWPPSRFETAFVSAAHQEQDIERTVGQFAEALRRLP